MQGTLGLTEQTKRQNFNGGKKKEALKSSFKISTHSLTFIPKLASPSPLSNQARKT